MCKICALEFLMSLGRLTIQSDEKYARSKPISPWIIRKGFRKKQAGIDEYGGTRYNLPCCQIIVTQMWRSFFVTE
jgi:hypothetical protein